MSELYDSLDEDEGNRVDGENEKDLGSSSPDSLDPLVPIESDRNGRNLKNCEKCDDFKKHDYTLPKISNSGSKKGLANVVVDSEILSQQGLQVNEDGSISRSPRLDFEQLPFVTREYQTMLFQKKQNYQLSRMNSHAGNGKVGLNKSSSEAKKVAGKGEKKRVRSLSCSNGRSSTKEFMDHNLTDAMKQKLLEKHLENSPGNRLDDQLRKVRPIANYLRESSGQITSSDDLFQRTRRLFSTGSLVKLPDVATKSSNLKRQSRALGKSTEAKILKNLSDVSLHRFKPQLSYLERRQKEIGFDPLHLRYGHPKCFSDTNRSNFGDSTTEKLSEVSSRALSTGKIGNDEEEEAFYRSLMERDSREQLGQRTTRSEAQLRMQRLIDWNNSNSSSKKLKNTKKVISGCQKNNKLTAINLSVDAEQDALSPKKSCHYCSSNSNTSINKAELALKARAYGFMANARNVFRWKNQSVTDRKTGDNSNATDRKRTHAPDQFKGPQKEGTGFKKIESSKKSDFILPQFDAQKNDETNFATEILQRMRYCLDKDISSSKKMGSNRSEQLLREINANN